MVRLERKDEGENGEKGGISDWLVLVRNTRGCIEGREKETKRNGREREDSVGEKEGGGGIGMRKKRK